MSWDVTELVYDNVSLITQDSQVVDVVFNHDGTLMYEVGLSTSKIYQWELSTPYDLSSAVYNSVNYALPISPSGLTFKPDGTIMYVTRASYIHQFDLDVAWDVSTAVDNSKSTFAGDSYTQAVMFSLDGLRTVCHQDTGYTYERLLNTAWEVGDNAVNGTNQPLNDWAMYGGCFSPDTTMMFEVGTKYKKVYQWDLSTAGVLSSSSYSGLSKSISTESGNPSGIAFKPDGTRMLLSDSSDQRIYQYSVPPTPKATGLVEVTATAEVTQIYYYANATVEVTATAEAKEYVPSALGSVEVTATAEVSQYVPSSDVNISVTATGYAEGSKSDTNTFTFAYSLQRTQIENTFKFIYSLEQPQIGTKIITRVNV